MAAKTCDVIVIGTGAGGGMSIKTLCEAGLTVCALNSGRRLDPAKDFRNHRQPYDMLYRGFGAYTVIDEVGNHLLEEGTGTGFPWLSVGADHIAHHAG